MNINFSKQLIKGRITEAIFEEVFRISQDFSIIPIGYEYTIPELAQYQHHVHVQQVLKNLRDAPDFALISQDKSKVFLVEVKYRHTLENLRILEIAQNLHPKWNPIFLFVATQTGFYFDSCKNIVENNGNMQLLSDMWIERQTQKEYLTLLHEFIS